MEKEQTPGCFGFVLADVWNTETLDKEVASFVFPPPSGSLLAFPETQQKRPCFIKMASRWWYGFWVV